MGEDRAVSATEVAKNSPLKNVMGETDIALDELHLAVDKLSSKLTPLAAQTINDTPQKDVVEPYPGSSEVVQRLSEQLRSIRNATEYVRSMIRGVEV